MLNNIPSDENITNPENPLPESYRNLIEYRAFSEITESGENEEKEKEKCR